MNKQNKDTASIQIILIIVYLDLQGIANIAKKGQNYQAPIYNLTGIKTTRLCSSPPWGISILSKKVA